MPGASSEDGYDVYGIGDDTKNAIDDDNCDDIIDYKCQFKSDIHIIPW